MQPSPFEWINIAAIVVGPVLALGAQRVLDSLRDKKRSRTQIYLTLMAYRSTPLHREYVRALNSLDAVFDRRRDQPVRHCWELLLAHAATDPSQDGWVNKLDDRRIDLYQAVGRAVGYDHSVDYIKNRIYSPNLYSAIEADETIIRKGLAEALSSGNLKVSLYPSSEDQTN